MWTVRTMMTAALVALLAATAAYAEDGWELSLGAGVVGEPVYEGAHDYYATPIPTANLSWTSGGLSLSASILDGLGVTYVHEPTRLLAMASLNSGASRERDGYSLVVVPVEHTARTERLLEGTPDATGILAADATLGYITPVGLVGATAGYRPTRLEYPAGNGSDETHHGFLYSLLYMIGLPLTDRIEVSTIALLEAMDGRYADAWYTVETDTAALEEFDAQPGLLRTRFVLDSTAMISERFGISLMAAQTVLLGDAARSPYTERQFQTSVILSSFYSFGWGGRT